MNAARPIVSVTYAEMTAPVVRSQTVPVLAALRAAGREVDAVAFASPRRFVFPSERRAHRHAAAALAAATSRAPAVLSYRPRATEARATGKALARTLEARGLQRAVLLCRQARATLAAVEARERLGTHDGPQVVYDLRGIRPEEYLVSVGKTPDELTHDERMLYDGYREREAAAYERCDALLVVSRPMLRHVQATYGPRPAPALVLPNHAMPVHDAEALRALARKRLRIADDAVVLMYMGTLAAWQLPDSFLLLATAVRRELPLARVLFVTPDEARARAALRATGVADAVVRSALPGTAHELAAAGDYGFLLRANDLVNRVASPVKFGEYLAVGARPVMTAGIGDQSELCVTERLGVLVGMSDASQAAATVVRDAEQPGTVDAAGRERRRAWVAANITPERTAERLTQFLAGL